MVDAEYLRVSQSLSPHTNQRSGLSWQMEVELEMGLDMDCRVVGSVGECMEYCQDGICLESWDREILLGKSVVRIVSPNNYWSHFQAAKGTLHEARTLHCCTLNHLTFSTFTQHKGNSFVLVRRPSLPSIPVQIDSILQVPTNKTYFVIQFFLKTLLEKPFQQYPVVHMSLWFQNLGQLVIVKPQDLESHFAWVARC